MSANTVAIRSAVRNALKDFTAGDLILVAASGGADSLALAHALSLEAPKLALRVEGVTVDHQLQSQSSVQAEKVVAALKTMGIEKIHVIKVDVDITDGLEASARRARYKVFQQALETYGSKVFLLGHTKNDQAEGVLLGLARGSGTKSLSGMAEISGPFIRPFLNVDRSTTQAACVESGIEYWNDPHNLNTEFTRVRVRESILPLIEKEIGPGIVDALSRSAKILREDATALDEWAERVFDEVNPSDIEISLLADLPIAVRSRVLRLAIYDAGAPSGSISATHLAPIEAFVSDWRGQGHTSLPGGVKVCRISGRLSLSKP